MRAIGIFIIFLLCCQLVPTSSSGTNAFGYSLDFGLEILRNPNQNFGICTIHLKDIDGYEAIFIEDGELITPHYGNFIFVSGQQFYVDCGDNRRSVICMGDDNYWYEGRQVKYHEFSFCGRKVTARGIPRTTPCGHTGNIIDVGFCTNFVKLYEICFDEARLTPIYTKHTIHGSSISEGLNLDVGRYFSSFRPHPVGVYLSAYRNQQQRIVLPSYSNTELDVLQKGHLTPVGDQILSNYRQSTNYYENVVPQFKSINELGRWRYIERYVIACAKRIQTSFPVLQGMYRVLRYQTPRNTNEYIYLADGQKIPVPEIVWKFARFSDNIEVVFLTVNNPNLGNELQNFCNSNCNAAEIALGVNMPNKNGIYCCTANDVVSRHPDFPIPWGEMSHNGGSWLPQSGVLGFFSRLFNKK